MDGGWIDSRSVRTPLRLCCFLFPLQGTRRMTPRLDNSTSVPHIHQHLRPWSCPSLELMPMIAVPAVASPHTRFCFGPV